MSEYSHLCPKDSMPSFHQEVFQYLWNIIKQSKLCCCVSKFYCSTSKTLESCPEGCCGKCLIVISVDENIESSDANLDSGSTDSDEDFENETSEDSNSEHSCQSEDYF